MEFDALTVTDVSSCFSDQFGIRYKKRSLMHQMVKFIGLIRLKPGYDPNETWKLWQTKHTVWAKNSLLPELKQYTINRVIETIGESNVYGFSEMIFEDAESCKRAFKRLLSSPPDEVLPRFELDRLILEFVDVPLGE